MENKEIKKMAGRNLELSEDALDAVTGGSVSPDQMTLCPKCGRWYESGSSCMCCLPSDLKGKVMILCSNCGSSFEYGSSCPNCRV